MGLQRDERRLCVSSIEWCSALYTIADYADARDDRPWNITISSREEEESACILVVGVVLAFFFDFLCELFLCQIFTWTPFVSHLFKTFLWPFNLCFMFVSLRCVFECGVWGFECGVWGGGRLIPPPTIIWTKKKKAKKNKEADRGREEIYDTTHIRIFAYKIIWVLHEAILLLLGIIEREREERKKQKRYECCGIFDFTFASRSIWARDVIAKLTAAYIPRYNRTEVIKTAQTNTSTTLLLLFFYPRATINTINPGSIPKEALASSQTAGHFYFLKKLFFLSVIYY